MATPHAEANRILRLLPEEDAAQLLESGTVVQLDPDTTLQEPGRPIEHVYFPRSGVISIRAVVSDGAAVEAATVGREGMDGWPVFLGARIATTRSVVQVAGDALRVESKDLLDEISRSRRLSTLLARYVEILFIESAQLTACNRLHSVQQRCARSLLVWLDRLADGRIPITQESLSEALGVRRASVTEAVGMLAQFGAIEQRRGSIIVTDRETLESEACECYGLITSAFQQEI
jgi:CRP-like cAMP-binding protein